MPPLNEKKEIVSCYCRLRFSFACVCSTVLTTLENMKISGNLLILENSGDLKYTQGIHVFQMPFFVTIWNTTSRHVGFRGCSWTYVMMLLKNMFCNSARKVVKWLLRRYVTSGFHFIIVWKRLFTGSGKPGKLREFYFANFVSMPI